MRRQLFLSFFWPCGTRMDYVGEQSSDKCLVEVNIPCPLPSTFDWTGSLGLSWDDTFRFANKVKVDFKKVQVWCTWSWSASKTPSKCLDRILHGVSGNGAPSKPRKPENRSLGIPGNNYFWPIDIDHWHNNRSCNQHIQPALGHHIVTITLHLYRSKQMQRACFSYRAWTDSLTQQSTCSLQHSLDPGISRCTRSHSHKWLHDAKHCLCGSLAKRGLTQRGRDVFIRWSGIACNYLLFIFFGVNQAYL